MLLFIVLLLVIVPITNFLHEFGHIIIARFLKIHGTMIVMGIGPMLLDFSLFGTRVQVHMIYFIGALSTSESQREISDWQKGVISLGGPFINLIIGILGYIGGMNANPYLSLFIPFNLWVGVINLLPYKLFQRESDGYSFIKFVYHHLKSK